MGTALLSVLGKFVVMIFSSILTDLLNTPAKQVIIKRYEGKVVAPRSNANRLLDKYSRLRDGSKERN